MWDRLGLACETGFTLFLAAVVVGLYNFLAPGGTRMQDLVLVLGLPALTTAVFVLVSVFVPDLHSPRRIAFPLNITLPTVFLVMMMAVLVLSLRIGNSLTRAPGPIQVAAVWFQPRYFVAMTLAQVGVLTGLVLFSKQKQEAQRR